MRHKKDQFKAYKSLNAGWQMQCDTYSINTKDLGWAFRLPM